MIDDSDYDRMIDESKKLALNNVYRIKRYDPYKLKIPCMIGHKYFYNAYIDVDLPINVLSLFHYNTICSWGLEHKGLNFVSEGTCMYL